MHRNGAAVGLPITEDGEYLPKESHLMNAIDETARGFRSIDAPRSWTGANGHSGACALLVSNEAWRTPWNDATGRGHLVAIGCPELAQDRDTRMLSHFP